MQSVVNVLLPPLCPGCRAQLTVQGSLCGSCWQEIRFIDEPLCAVTGLPFAHNHGVGAVDPSALAHPPPWRQARSVMVYTPLVQRLVGRFKYSGRHECVRAFGRWMARAGHDLLSDADYIVPVPLYVRRLRQRGFNQAVELARVISRESGVELAVDMLERIRPTRSQIGLSVAARHRNMVGAFAPSLGAEARIKGSAFVLVDDVLTSGATLASATRALQRAGAGRVDVLTLARVARGEG